MRFADVELVVRTALAAALPGVRVVSVLPSTLVPPVVRVARGPGGDDRVHDMPAVDIDCFAATRSAMWILAEDVRQAMLDLRNSAAGGSLIDSVTTRSGPMFLPYGNPDVQRAVAVYGLTLRIQP